MFVCLFFFFKFVIVTERVTKALAISFLRSRWKKKKGFTTPWSLDTELSGRRRRTGCSVFLVISRQFLTGFAMPSLYSQSSLLHRQLVICSVVGFDVAFRLKPGLKSQPSETCRYHDPDKGFAGVCLSQGIAITQSMSG